MCAERVQRILMAIMIGVTLFLFYKGLTLFANIIGGFIILMILIWAFTNFCPSIWVFKKIFGPCNFEKDS